LLVSFQNGFLPSDNFFVNKQLKESVIFRNELQLSSGMNAMHQIPLLIAVRSEEDVENDTFQHLLQTITIGLNFWGFKNGAIVATNVQEVSIMQPNTDHVVVIFQLKILDVVCFAFEEASANLP
jgi:hypothetical protein